MIITLTLTLERLPGDYPDATDDDLINDLVSQISSGETYFLTDDMIPYHVTAILSTRRQT